MIRKKKGTLKEGTPGLEKGRTAKLESKPMEAAPPDAAVETAPDMSMGEQISNLPTMTAPDTFSHSDEVFPIVGIGASAGGLEKARKELAATKISEDEVSEYAEELYLS